MNQNWANSEKANLDSLYYYKNGIDKISTGHDGH